MDIDLPKNPAAEAFAPDEIVFQDWSHLPGYTDSVYSPRDDAAMMRLGARAVAVPFGWIRRQPGERFSSAENRKAVRACIKLSNDSDPWQMWRKHVPPELIEDHAYRDPNTIREIAGCVGYDIQRLVSTERNLDDLVGAICNHRTDGGTCSRHRFSDVVVRMSGADDPPSSGIRAVAAEPMPPKSILGFFPGIVRRIGALDQNPVLYADICTVHAGGSFSQVDRRGGDARVILDPTGVEFPLKYAIFESAARPPPVASVGERMQISNAAAIVVSNVDWNDSAVEAWRVYVVILSTRFIEENRPIVVEAGPVVDARQRGAPAEVQPPLSIDDAARTNATLIPGMQYPGQCTVCGNPALVSFTQRGGGIYSVCSRACYDTLVRNA
jgi:hypothetical protein